MEQRWGDMRRRGAVSDTARFLSGYLKAHSSKVR